MQPKIMLPHSMRGVRRMRKRIVAKLHKLNGNHTSDFNRIMERVKKLDERKSIDEQAITGSFIEMLVDDVLKEQRA